MFTLQTLLDTNRKPAPYEPGDEFWNDPYISKQLLKTHLATDTDQGSYKPETLRAICRYLPSAMDLKQSAAIADLGCGPGLYCAKLSGMGYALTGIDRSESSLAYAREHAPGARFVRQSYLEPFGAGQFDAAVMISQDYGVLRPEHRQLLLQNIHTTLKPGGYFAFDMPSPRAFADRTAQSAPNWYAAAAGFYRPHPHFVLEKHFAYPDIPAQCTVISVLDTEIKTYRFWMTFFSPAAIRAELEENGFAVKTIHAGLTGVAYTDSGSALGIVCQRI